MFKKRRKNEVLKILDLMNSQIKLEESRLAFIETYVDKRGSYTNSDHDQAYCKGRLDALNLMKMHIDQFY